MHLFPPSNCYSRVIVVVLWVLSKCVGAEQYSETHDVNRNRNSPILFLPGFGATILEAKLDKEEVDDFMCSRQSDWYKIWLDLTQIIGIDCLIDNFRLEYNTTSRKTRNPPGVQIRVMESNSSLSPVEYIAGSYIEWFAYGSPIFEHLVSNLGYTRDKDLRAAPYDFRKTPNEMPNYFEELKATVQDLYATNSNEPVTLICHSLGCSNTLFFLQRQTQEWKDHYIKRLISLGAAWGGSSYALKFALFGDDFNMPFLLDAQQLRTFARSFPSLVYLLPLDNVQNDNTELVTYLPSNDKMTDDIGRVYTRKDIKSLFEDFDYPEGIEMYQDIKGLLGKLEPPGVEVNCFYGSGYPTAERFVFTSAGGIKMLAQNLDFGVDYKEIKGDGDGYILAKTAQVCLGWGDKQRQPIHHKQMNLEHTEMVISPLVINYIVDIITRP